MNFRKTKVTSKAGWFRGVSGVCLGLLLIGSAFGQTGTVGAIAGYTSTQFSYNSLHTGLTVTNGGLVHVSATFNKPAGMELFGLKAVPTLPAGWSIDWDPTFQVGLYDFNVPSNAGSTPSGPFVTAAPLWVPVSGKFLYGPGNLGLTPAASIKLNFAVYVPPGDTGDKEISLLWQFALSNGVDITLLCVDNPQPVLDLNVPATPLVVSDVSLTAGGGGLQFGLNWNAPSGVLHTVWWADDLQSGWPSGQVFTTSSGAWTDPASASVTQRFYRVRTATAP